MRWKKQTPYNLKCRVTVTLAPARLQSSAMAEDPPTPSEEGALALEAALDSASSPHGTAPMSPLSMDRNPSHGAGLDCWAAMALRGQGSADAVTWTVALGNSEHTACFPACCDCGCACGCCCCNTHPSISCRTDLPVRYSLLTQHTLALQRRCRTAARCPGASCSLCAPHLRAR